MIPPFQTTFAVPLSCESCIDDVSTTLHKLDGIHSITASLPSQLITTLGTAPPSTILRAIQSTGRDAILRGTGASHTAAVCILETHASAVPDRVRGLARMVQVAPNLTLVDLTIRGSAQGTYHVTVRETGDISRGAASVGGVWGELGLSTTDSTVGGQSLSASMTKKGVFGSLEVNRSGVGSVFLDRPVQVWEMIGRSMVVSKVAAWREGGGEEAFEAEDADTLVGVIARSAGVWENDKTVCSCSGKTVWEEREEQRGRGML